MKLFAANLRLFVALLLLAALTAIISVGFSTRAHARWKEEYAQVDPKIQQWFGSRHNKHGEYCCFEADGYKPSDEDITWDTKDQNYRVRINGQWVTVDDYAKLDEPNIIGRAIVWSYQTVRENGVETHIRCFIPGAEN